MIIMMQINNQSKLASYTGLCHILFATLWSHMNKGCHYAPKPIVGNEYIKKVNEIFCGYFYSFFNSWIPCSLVNWTELHKKKLCDNNRNIIAIN